MAEINSKITKIDYDLRRILGSNSLILNENNSIAKDFYPRQQVEIVLRGEFLHWTPDIEKATLRAIAAIAEVSYEQVTILRVYEGSIVLVLEMPRKGGDLLVLFYRSGNLLLEDVGVIGVRKISSPDYVFSEVSRLARAEIDRIEGIVRDLQAHTDYRIERISNQYPRYRIFSQTVTRGQRVPVSVIATFEPNHNIASFEAEIYSNNNETFPTIEAFLLQINSYLTNGFFAMLSSGEIVYRRNTETTRIRSYKSARRNIEDTVTAYRLSKPHLDDLSSLWKSTSLGLDSEAHFNAVQDENRLQILDDFSRYGFARTFV